MKSGLVVVAVAVAISTALAGCTSPTPLLPDSLVASIQEDGREHTYDLAWQNSRLAVDLVEREDYAQLAVVALELTARLHRLETARAENMGDLATARTVAALEEGVTSRKAAENGEILSDSATKVLAMFDIGDFTTAKTHALEVLVIARWLADQQ